MNEHSRSRREGAVAGIEDHARDVAARDMWQRNAHPLDPAPLPQVEMIQRAGVDADDGASGARLRIRRFFVLENVRTAVAVKPDGFHATAISDASPSSRRCSAGPIFSRSPTMTVSSREGSRCVVAARVMSSAVSAMILEAKVEK